MSEGATPATVSPLRLDPDRALDGLEWAEVFGSSGRVEVEIGIGKGRFLLRMSVPKLLREF